MRASEAAQMQSATLAARQSGSTCSALRQRGVRQQCQQLQALPEVSSWEQEVLPMGTSRAPLKAWAVGWWESQQPWVQRAAALMLCGASWWAQGVVAGVSAQCGVRSGEPEPAGELEPELQCVALRQNSAGVCLSFLCWQMLILVSCDACTYGFWLAGLCFMWCLAGVPVLLEQPSCSVLIISPEGSGVSTGGSWLPDGPARLWCLVPVL